GPAILRQDERVLRLVRNFDSRGKLIAAICHGPQVLVSADILRGRRATGYYKIVHEVKDAGAEYENREAVVDGNLITSRAVGDIPAFIGAIFAYYEAAPVRKTA
ncbi:MAG: DJ-1/PfpI family protein, partial [Pseudomonadota bacterium]